MQDPRLSVPVQSLAEVGGLGVRRCIVDCERDTFRKESPSHTTASGVRMNRRRVPSYPSLTLQEWAAILWQGS